MKIMTFNLRFENDRDGSNGWVYRRDLVVDVIQRHAPALLGTQEGTGKQLEYLDKNLTQYGMVVPASRVPDKTSQYPTLFYRLEEFEVREKGDFWLSTTPDKHLSKDWDSAFPRMASYALFTEKRTDSTFWALVTHLDHVGVEARQEQAKILRKWIRERQEPVILMGDFNDVPGSSVHRILTSEESGLQDTWRILGKEEGEQSATRHDFQGVSSISRLDWILSSLHFEVKKAHILRDHDEDRYPSDHFPYEAELEWKKGPASEGA